jgi:hypothetical protein
VTIELIPQSPPEGYHYELEKDFEAVTLLLFGCITNS